METGYVFLNLDPGTKRDSITAIRDIKMVKEAKLVIGSFDAVVKIEGSTIEQLEKIYLNKIDRVLGVRNSRLYIVACPRSRK
jgi:DNA-binding Lrp family transcriptional regulator